MRAAPPLPALALYCTGPRPCYAPASPARGKDFISSETVDVTPSLWCYMCVCVCVCVMGTPTTSLLYLICNQKQETQVIYFSSLTNSNIPPGNSPSADSNRFQSPLELDANLEDDVCQQPAWRCWGLRDSRPHFP